MALPANGDDDYREFVERERDLLWCLAIIKILDVVQISQVTREFLDLLSDKKFGESIPGSIENP